MRGELVSFGGMHFSYAGFWLEEIFAMQRGVCMAAVTTYRCEICGTESANPIHWFIIKCNADELRVLKWKADAASEHGARHYFGEAHASVYMSRWLESACSPGLPDFNRPSVG